MSAPDGLDVPLHYCRDKIGGAGSALYYSLLFLPPAPRTALIALHALHRELDDIADKCADPGVARLKFTWWQEELANMFQGRARHPVTLLLAPAARQLAPSRDTLHELIRAAETRLPPLRYARFDELLDHAQRTGGAVAVLSAAILGGELTTARSLGTALELAELLCGLGTHTRHDRLLLPLEDLTRFNVPVADILRGKENAGFHELMAFEVDRVERLLRELLQALTPNDRRTLLPLRIQARIALATLTAARRQGYTVLQQPRTLTPLRLLWIAWRTKNAGRDPTA
ncbi:MAG: squalene/phytoene synthase family protein [Gammaproteobacteria bacterium]|nr:squalene/phytoene synthase family protein [Gammaproteobacteria bacterium]